MVLLKFAISMEEEIICQTEILSEDSEGELAELFGMFLKTEGEILGLLKRAAEINPDLEGYPPVTAGEILGADNTLVQSTLPGSNISQRNICVLWMMYALAEKSAQYYHQAALNSPHPALKLFVGSLGEVKNILRGRVATRVRMAYNDVWGQVGFAPFVLGKE